MTQAVQDAAPVMVAEQEPRPQTNGQDDHVNGVNEDGDHAGGGQGIVITDPADLPEDKKKKKKKKKPASKRGLVSIADMESSIDNL